MLTVTLGGVVWNPIYSYSQMVIYGYKGVCDKT